MKRAVVYIPLLIVLGFATVIVLARPVAFQKAYAIVEGPFATGLEPGAQALDVCAYMQGIPFRDQSRMVYAVDPEKKYRQAIIEGDGNCSNLVFGTAYYLYKNGIDYQIVHVLPRGEFLRGMGHTVLRTRYTLDEATRVGLVDVLEGGIPANDGKPMDIDDLKRGALPDVTIWSMNAKKDSTSRFYGGLLDSSTVGYIRGTEANHYFDFLERFHVSVGNERFEKYLYDGISIVLGKYPKIHVDLVSVTFQGHSSERLLCLFALVYLRIMLFAGPFVILAEIVIHVSGARDAGHDSGGMAARSPGRCARLDVEDPPEEPVLSAGMGCSVRVANQRLRVAGSRKRRASTSSHTKGAAPSLREPDAAPGQRNNETPFAIKTTSTANLGAEAVPAHDMATDS